MDALLKGSLTVNKRNGYKIIIIIIIIKMEVRVPFYPCV